MYPPPAARTSFNLVRIDITSDSAKHCPSGLRRSSHALRADLTTVPLALLPSCSPHSRVIAAQMCSIGFRSGDLGGCGNTVIWGCSSNQVLTTRPVCIGLLSWRRLKGVLPGNNRAWTEGRRTSSRISTYLSEVKRPSPTSVSSPTPAAHIQPKSPAVILPLLFVAITFSCSYLESKIKV